MATKSEQIKALKERLTSLGMEPIRIEPRTYKEPLTEFEMAELAVEIDEHLETYKEAKNEKKAIDKVLNGKMETAMDEMIALKDLRKAGFREVEGDCIIALDKERNVRVAVSIKTGLEVSKEAIQDKDLQVTMPVADPAEEAPAAPAEDAPQAPAVLEIGYDSGRGEGGPIEVAGTVVTDEDLVGLGGEEKPEGVVKNDQLRAIELQKVNKVDVFFVTTAEGLILFTEDKGMATTAQEAVESRAYVRFSYTPNAEARNFELTSMEIAEVPVDETQLVPEDMQTGDDPDGPSGGGDDDDDHEPVDPEEDQ